MPEVYGYQDLIVWQKAVQLTVAIYHLLREFPKEEVYGISSQMKRAAVSIPSNIAEGYRRRGVKERRQFYAIAYGSAAELETQLFVSKQLAFGTPKHYEAPQQLLGEVAKMLNVMSR